MNVLVITPAVSGSRAGNRATALRYRTMLIKAGHDCRVEQDIDGCHARDDWPVDCAIVLHAVRGRNAVNEAKHLGIPLIVVLTGTDYYRFQATHAAEFIASLEAADVLICLHDLAWRAIPDRFHSKLEVVKQSVAFEEELVDRANRNIPLETSTSDFELDDPGGLTTSRFPVAVIGHLRKEKDPFRAARAARLLPPDSGIQILHAGGAHAEAWAALARTEVASNQRYHWLGELSRSSTRQLLMQSKLMVISSIMEGGANIISEACVLGCPVVASDIDGNMGLLGCDHPGLFRVGDEHSLMAQLQRCENDIGFLNSLGRVSERLAEDFSPEREAAGLLHSIARACLVSQ